jgi:hypothetical protein
MKPRFPISDCLNNPKDIEIKHEEDAILSDDEAYVNGEPPLSEEEQELYKIRDRIRIRL